MTMLGKARRCLHAIAAVLIVTAMPVLAGADQDNRFRLEGLWPGTWTLRTDIDGHLVRAVLQIAPDATEMRFDLDVDRTTDDAGKEP
jgi:hypothetical protein